LKKTITTKTPWSRRRAKYNCPNRLIGISDQILSKVPLEPKRKGCVKGYSKEGSESSKNLLGEVLVNQTVFLSGILLVLPSFSLSLSDSFFMPQFILVQKIMINRFKNGSP
jgi:hypothetical protein